MKAWLRLTTSDERLPSLDMMSVYREKTSKDKQGFIESALDRFGRDLKRLQILFLGRPVTNGAAGMASPPLEKCVRDSLKLLYF